MTKINIQAKPSWLTNNHELPITPDKNAPELWSENYLSYVWSPANNVGVYIHLCHRIKGFELWDEQLVIALPDDRYLLSKGSSKGRVDRGPVVAGIHFRCDEPFVRWTKTFHGGARLISGDEYRAGPVKDGEWTPVKLEMVFDAMCPPHDFGAEHMDQSWGNGHFEQHHIVTGRLSFNKENYEISGTGMRDHSWGSRDYHDIGTTTWVHGQFPKSGRAFMAVLVTGLPPKPELSLATISDHNSTKYTKSIGLPVAKSLADCDSDFEFQLIMPDGAASKVKAKILNSDRAALIGPSEISLGTYTAPIANHHYIDSFTRFDWDGEIGYGVTERTVDLLK